MYILIFRVVPVDSLFCLFGFNANFFLYCSEQNDVSLKEFSFCMIWKSNQSSEYMYCHSLYGYAVWKIVLMLSCEAFYRSNNHIKIVWFVLTKQKYQSTSSDWSWKSDMQPQIWQTPVTSFSNPTLPDFYCRNTPSVTWVFLNQTSVLNLVFRNQSFQTCLLDVIKYPHVISGFAPPTAHLWLRNLLSLSELACSRFSRHIIVVCDGSVDPA